MTRVVSFELPMPPSVNKMYSNLPGKGRVKTKEARQWAFEAGWMLIAQRNRLGSHMCFLGPVEVHVAAYRPASKRRDLDNILKALLDLLTSTKTIDDDSQVVAINARWVEEGVPCTVTVRDAA
ncbi:RusA family crossover junction endodeoxyribonuclease [Rhizobium leguminosarum]|uniref:RusA family crossover junction endodeoxyribonuclease n=1 Tax=Rhizobium leguminosarum TaxID=384 RepID=UPI0003F59369|nr:RusA family crossover junction endodeoxyribonuclease [Rhizobium leguminosarum]